MHRAKRIAAVLMFASCFIFAAGGATRAQAPATVFEGARLITGEGGTPIADSTVVVESGRVTAVGRRGEVMVPPGAARIELSGKTVIPALVDAHVHMGYRRGLDFGQTNYTRENLTDTLQRFAYYGVAAILEAGTARSDLVYDLRRGGAAPGPALPPAPPRFGEPRARPRAAGRDTA